MPYCVNRITPEWWRNDRMNAEWGVSQNSVFLLTSKITLIPPHSVIPMSFQNAWNDMKWKITKEGYHSEGIPIIFTSYSSFQPVSSFKNDDGMTEWGWNEGYFWSKAKPLILKSPSFHHHLVILSQNPMHHKSFHSFEDIFKFNSQITPLTLYSFRRKFFSVRMRLEWIWNDLWMNESGAVSI